MRGFFCGDGIILYPHRDSYLNLHALSNFIEIHTTECFNSIVPMLISWP